MVLAPRPCGEDVVIARSQRIDVAHRVDVRKLTLQDERADDEVVMTVNVVTAARSAKDLVAEYPQSAEPCAASLIRAKVELSGESELPRDVPRCKSRAGPSTVTCCSRAPRRALRRTFSRLISSR